MPREARPFMTLTCRGDTCLRGLKTKSVGVPVATGIPTLFDAFSAVRREELSTDHQLNYRFTPYACHCHQVLSAHGHLCTGVSLPCHVWLNGNRMRSQAASNSFLDGKFLLQLPCNCVKVPMKEKREHLTMQKSRTDSGLPFFFWQHIL
jgi:hypothetical protein